MLKYYAKQPPIKDSRVKRVLPCLGGTSLLISPMFEYPESSTIHIEIMHYLVIEGNVEAASSIFAEIVTA